MLPVQQRALNRILCDFSRITDKGQFFRTIILTQFKHCDKIQSAFQQCAGSSKNISDPLPVDLLPEATGFCIPVYGFCGKRVLGSDPNRFEKPDLFFCHSGRSLMSEDLSHLSMDMVSMDYPADDGPDQVHS
jgi:hypothetical protein